MNKRILIIEDNELIRLNTVELLELENYDVFVAADGTEGTEIAKRELPDLILCDILMPNGDGYSVLNAIRSEPSLHLTKFIFLTAFSEKTEMDKGFALGANDFIVKPFEPSLLLERIHKCCCGVSEPGPGVPNQSS